MPKHYLSKRSHEEAQLAQADRESQRKLIAHALRVKESLAVTLRGIDNAVSEVAEKFDLYDEQ